MSGDMRETLGRFCTEAGWTSFRCRHDARVLALEPLEPRGQPGSLGPPASDLPRFLPAPLDLHVHGGGGHDAMDGEAAIRGLLQASARGGTGALLATSVTAPFADIDAFVDAAERVMAAPEAGEATLLGVHLEGPFINPGRLGAQPPHAASLDVERLTRWLARPAVRVVTYAPELDPDGVVPGLAACHGVRAQIGHTLCRWSEARAAFAGGAGVTHLWNAMSGASHRDGGAAIAALAFAEHAEIIADGIHVERAAFAAARRAIPALCAVTDATAATGMPDGKYRLGSLEVEKRGERVLLADGTLAGSCLTERRALEVLRAWDVDWPDIVRLTSAAPARWIGAEGFGEVVAGARAHWLELAPMNTDVGPDVDTNAGKGAESTGRTTDTRAVALWLDGVRHPFDDD